MELDEIKSAAENATKKFESAMNAWETVKSEVLPLGKKFDDLDADTKAKLAKTDKAIGEAIELSQKAQAQAKAAEEQQKEMEAQVKALELAFNRVPLGGNTIEEKAKELGFLRNRVINDFARKGGHKESLNDFVTRKMDENPEYKTLSVGSDPNGGFLVTPELGGLIKTKVFESSPIRMLASVTTISSNSYEVIVDYDEASSGWVSESGTRSTTNTPTFGKVDIPVHEMYANPKATSAALDDAVIDLEAWLADKVADKLARTEATAFVTGTGTGKPRGIMSYTAGTTISSGQIEQVNSGSASTFTYDGLVNLQNALKEAYQPSAVFLIKRATNAYLMQIKDGEGRPIFNMFFDKNVGMQPTIMGKPVYFADDVAAVSSNALAMAYGDIKTAYQVVDRQGTRIIRDPYTSKGFVEFYTSRRVGGGVVNYEALKIQKIST